MQKLKTKPFATATTMLLILSMAGAAILLPGVNGAQFPNTTIPTWAYLEVVPHQVGLGQTALMVMWIDKPPPTANGIYGDRWVNMTVKITDPDGVVTTLGPFKSDDAGGYSASYTPTKLGNYSAVFSFSGETLTGSLGNDGFPNLNNANIGDKYGASTSNTVNFAVVDEPYNLIPENPLPEEYWNHPIQAFNHLWSQYAGNWLGLGAVEFANTGNYNFAGNFNPYTKAPLTGHVVWAQQLVPGSAGGQIGGEFGGNAESNYYSGFQYQPKFAPIIMNGILYYQIMDNYNSLTQGFTAKDLRTGETLWTKNYNNYFANGSQDILLCGQVYVYKTMNTYGGQTYLWATRSNGSSTNLDCFDAATGNFLFTVWGGGGGGAFGRQNFEGKDGSLLQLFTNSSIVGGSMRQSLTLWNSSHCVNPGDSQFFSFTQNGNYPYNTGIMWSILLPNATSTGDPIPSWVFDDTGHSAWDPDNNIMILGASTGMYSAYGWNPGWVMKVGIDCNTGTQLWLKNTTQTSFAASMMMPSASNGTYVEYTKETFTFIGYSTKTGEKVWGPTEAMTNPLAYYDQTSAVCAYGCLYTWTFGGEVYCFNMSNGQKVWNWSTGDTGANTPYGTNPLWIIGNFEASVADGVFYVETGHDYGPPLFSGAKIYALNASTGQPIWDILNFASGSSLPIAYGYMLSFNAYDNRVYCYGKGQTATTVETSPVINSATQIQISGTVTDQSPGNTCLGIPAAGTPAVSDASMSRWMEYLYMQSPKPTNATGVPVTLSYIDSNNNYYTIGTTTSDVNGQFTYVFTPTIEGPYTIIATFEGSNSYFSSSAQTHVTYMNPATAAPTPTAQPPSMADQYFLPMSVIILVAIVIIGAVLALMVRKRP
jgi:outer membrane protein assembly factor BamB